MVDILRFSADLSIQASDGKRPSFSGIVYSGGAMRVSGYGLVVVDVAGADLSAPVPVLADHGEALGNIVGQAQAVARAGTITATGTLTEATEAGRTVVALARSGVSLQASIGFAPDRREFVQAGQRVAVNNQTITAGDGGLTVVRSGRLREISLVPIGADTLTRVNIAASAAKKGKRIMSDETTTPSENPTTPDPLTAAWNAEGMTSAERVAARWDSERWHDPSGLPRQRAHAAMLAATAGRIGFDDFERTLLLERLRDAEVANIRAERRRGPAIHASNRDVSLPAITAAFCRSAGLPNWDKQFKPEVCEAADKIGNLSLQEVLLNAAAEAGYSGGRHRIDNGNCRDVIRAAFSTHTITTMLTTTGNKFLLDGFNSVEQSWRAISRIRPVSDFKQVTSYRLTADAIYQELPPARTIKHGTLGQESYTNQAKTYAKLMALTRTDIINDDLGAFDDLRNRLGRGAALKLNLVFWAAFLNNSTFFTGARGNYQSGAGTALTDDGTALTAAEVLFHAITDTDGGPLGIEPAILLVPSALDAVARRLYVSSEMRDTTSDTRYGTANIFQNRFRPVTSAYLSNSTLTGNSSTAWYLLADPANLATVEVAFLDGQQNPTIESTDADFDTLGIQFRGYRDFGVALAEYRAGVKSAGA